MCHAPSSSRDDVPFSELLRGLGVGGERATGREMTRD
jgi:hypothetical protein